MSAGQSWGSEHFDGVSVGDAARWGLAVLVVATASWGVANGVQSLPSPALTLGEPEPAILIDLAPMAPEETIAEVESEPEVLPPEPIEEPLPEVEPELSEAVEPLPEPIQPPVEQPAEAEPVTPDIEPPPPEPEPAPEVDEPPEEIPPPVDEEPVVETVSDIPMPVMISPRLQEQRESTAALPKPAPRQPAPPAQPRQQTAAPASPPPAANTVSPQQWQTQVLAQLDRRKVYPRAAQADGVQGSVGISFSVSASGQITSVSIARSSGSPVLDQAALDTARRASPLPTPPAGYANRAITATIRFSLR